MQFIQIGSKSETAPKEIRKGDPTGYRESKKAQLN